MYKREITREKQGMFAYNSFLWWDLRNVYTRPPIGEYLVQEVEFVKPSGPLPGSLLVYPLHMVDDMAARQLGVVHLEIIVVILNKVCP